MSQTVVVKTPGSTVVQSAQVRTVVARTTNTTVVQREAAPKTVVVTRGIPGPEGKPGPIGPAGGMAFTRQSDAALSALRVVWEDEAGVVHLLDHDDGDHIDLIAGLTITGTSAPGDVTVQRSGPVDDAAWNWTPGRVWLGPAGTLTQTPPADGYDVLVGHAASPTRLYLDIQDPIQLED